MSRVVNDVLPTCSVQKIYPSEHQLGTINNCIKCEEVGCDATFVSRSNYTMHLEKHHDKPQPPKNCIKQFFCPVKHCFHNKNNNHFNKMKCLKQHYLKTHAEKKYVCEKCSKRFVTETLKYKHLDVCGMIYNCLQCNCKYSSKEGLATHCRRKNHVFPPSKIVKPLPIRPKLSSTTQTVQIIPVFIQINNNIEPLKRVDIAVQTDANIRPICTAKKSKSPVKRKSTRQTQTCVKKKSKISTETQTIGDCILRRAVLDAKIEESDELSYKKCSSETQTSRNSAKIEETNMIPSDLDFTNLLFQSSSCQTNFIEPLKLDETYQNDKKCTETQTLTPMTSFDSAITNLTKHNSSNCEIDMIESLKLEHSYQNDKKCTETQTFIPTSFDGAISNLTKNNSSNCQTNMIKLEINDKECTETQTLIPTSFDHAINNVTEDNTNFMKNSSPDMLLQSSSSQTSVDNLNIFEDSAFGNSNNSETQTDLIYKDEFLQSTVFTSHIETQTNEELDNYINMYTQTCDELFLSDLEFTNIQTQTNWPDYEMFVSTETQTLSSNINNNNITNDKTFLDLGLSNREISHMETQTDMEFKQLLEEINA